MLATYRCVSVARSHAEQELVGRKVTLDDLPVVVRLEHWCLLIPGHSDGDPRRRCARLGVFTLVSRSHREGLWVRERESELESESVSGRVSERAS